MSVQERAPRKDFSVGKVGDMHDLLDEWFNPDYLKSTAVHYRNSSDLINEKLEKEAIRMGIETDPSEGNVLTEARELLGSVYEKWLEYQPPGKPSDRIWMATHAAIAYAAPQTVESYLRIEQDSPLTLATRATAHLLAAMHSEVVPSDHMASAAFDRNRNFVRGASEHSHSTPLVYTMNDHIRAGISYLVQGMTLARQEPGKNSY